MQGTHSLSRDGHMQEADGQGPGAVPLRRRWGEEPGGDVPYWSVVGTLKAGAGGDASHSRGQAPGLGRRTGGLGTAAAAEQHDLSQAPHPQRKPGEDVGRAVPMGASGSRVPDTESPQTARPSHRVHWGVQASRHLTP
uniref:Uncharacterized protein n=1 Tax=Rousettus aegyptiacus TaxID=9407 RepID=A0A7J8JG61_ROUAE|nr:hypothetical protein HJG63_010076 [Rousettus aegyptiacus]